MKRKYLAPAEQFKSNPFEAQSLRRQRASNVQYYQNISKKKTVFDYSCSFLLLVAAFIYTFIWLHCLD